MAVMSLQVTQTGAGVPIAPSKTYARWVIFQNNAGHAIRLGGANVTASLGIALNSTGATFIPPIGDSGHTDLGQWYAFGTNADLLEVTYDSMN